MTGVQTCALPISANEVCPQPQTEEHLAALEIIGNRKILIVQTKIDLVSRSQAEKHAESIRAFVKGTVCEQSSIIPVCEIGRASCRERV